MIPTDLVLTPEDQREIIRDAVALANLRQASYVAGFHADDAWRDLIRIYASMLANAERARAAVLIRQPGAWHLLDAVRDALDARFGLAAQIREEREGEVGRG